MPYATNADLPLSVAVHLLQHAGPDGGRRRRVGPNVETSAGKEAMTDALKRWLLYVTNNEETSRHEQAFDIAFFIVNTVALAVGSGLLIWYASPHWIPFLVIEYTWALDNMRHNRP